MVPARGESRFDQPYFGEFPKMYAHFSAKEIDRQREAGPVGKVRQADVIFVGDAHGLTEIKNDAGTRIEYYQADVQVVRTIKGALKQKRLSLKFRPSATSISDGARHVCRAPSVVPVSFEQAGLRGHLRDVPALPAVRRRPLVHAPRSAGRRAAGGGRGQDVGLGASASCSSA